MTTALMVPPRRVDLMKAVVADLATREAEGARRLRLRFRKIYIAGPMTGYTAYNVRLFHQEAERARMRYGPALIVTPFETNSRVWRRHFGRNFDPYHDRCDYGDPIIREMITEDIQAMLGSDLVIALEGWTRSRGAGMEVQIAHLASIPVVDAFGVAVTLRAVVNWQEADTEVVSVQDEAIGLPAAFTPRGVRPL